MLKLTLDGEAFDLPTSYKEITYNQYLDIAKHGKDAVSTFAILLKIDVTRVENLKLSDSEYKKMIASLSWFSHIPDLSVLDIPKSLKVGKKLVSVPQKLEYETFGQRLEAQMKIAEAQDKKLPDTEILPFLVAIYLQPQITGKLFDSKTLSSIEELIKECSFEDVYKIGTFFFRKSYGLPKFGLNHLSVFRPMKQKRLFGSWQVVKNWIKRLRIGGWSMGMLARVLKK